MAQRLTVQVERFGPSPPLVKQAGQALLRHTAVRGLLNGGEHRLLAVRLLDPPRKTREPQEPSRVRATIYDYAQNKTIVAEADLADLDKVDVKETARQPLPSQDEFQAAVAVLKEHPTLGAEIKSGKLVPYPPMPPLVHTELPEGNLDRTVTVGLLPDAAGVKHEIVGISLARREVTRYDGGAPSTALAADDVCGVPVSAGQATAERGTAGRAWVTVKRGNTVLWKFMVVRPAASSGQDGSGVELRYVDYRGRRVLHQAHVPILNVRYGNDACGPYRDWQWQEGKIKAPGRNVAPGFRLCSAPAQTIMQSHSDTGDFLGTAIYVSGDEVVLVNELEAGWYRYVSEWRLDADGTIRPRFGFAAVSSSCVCRKHHHHAYWRLDFDIGTPGNNRVREFNDPPLTEGGPQWHTIQFETKRMRTPERTRRRRWRVENAAGRGYAIRPGANDRTAVGDAYAKGDLWFLRYRPGQIDDYPISATQAELDKYVNNDSLVNKDVVVWYAAHFTHDVHSHSSVGHIVGPDLVPVNW
jgi:Copper amine oxidase, enzyme domain